MTNEEREYLRKLIHDDKAIIVFNVNGARGGLTTVRRVARVDLADPDSHKQYAWTTHGTNINLENVSLWMFQQLNDIKLPKDDHAQHGESQYLDW